MKTSDIALWEINEAFSVVIRAAEKVLQLDPAKVNVNGYVLHSAKLVRLYLTSFPVVPSLSATLSATPDAALLCLSFTR